MTSFKEVDMQIGTCPKIAETPALTISVGSTLTIPWPTGPKQTEKRRNSRNTSKQGEDKRIKINTTLQKEMSV